MRIAIIAALLLLGAWATARAEKIKESTLQFGRFGTVHLYRQGAQPAHVVLFVSGEQGWSRRMVDMARVLAGRKALIVGIDNVHYLEMLNQSSETCLYPAAEFESLSKYVQRKLGYPEYMQPVLAGYSSGATLVYAILLQAPGNTFQGALSLGFCPTLPLTRPLCNSNQLTGKKVAGKDLYAVLPSRQLPNPWVILQGESDAVCTAEEARAFVAQTPGAGLVVLPGVGHDLAAPPKWMPQFEQAFTQLTGSSATAPSADLKLPLIEVPPRAPAKPWMAVLITGDGGWAGIDKDIAGQLAVRGVGVVGLNSLKYFWTRRTPEGAADDLTRLLAHYLSAWQKEKVVLIGYSQGADVLPFMAARLPADLRGRVALIALLAPGTHAAFEFHLSDWLGGGRPSQQFPIRPEVAKLADLPLLCFYGTEERDSLCRHQLPPAVTVIPMSGGHHLGGAYKAIVERILQAVAGS